MTITDSGIENSMEREAFWQAANKIDQARFKKDYKETIDNLSATGFRDYYRFIGKFARVYKLAGWKEYNEYDPVVIENLNEELAKKEKTTEKLDLINSFHDEELKSPEFLFDSKMQVLYDIIDDFFVLNDKEEGINKVLRSFSSDDKAAFISKIQKDDSLLIKLMEKVDGLEQGAMVSLIGEMFISSGFLTDNKVQHLENGNEKIKASFDKGTIKIKIGKTKREAKPFDVVSMDYAGSQICIPALMLLSKQEKNIWETLWGALQGEFNEDPTGMEILVDMGLNFIPFVGQACDIRDIAACLKKLVADKRVNEVMIWVTLLLTAIGCVPYAGDVIKAGCKAILKGADDIVLTVLRKLDAEDVYKAFKIFKKKFLSSIDDAIAMVNKWIKEAGNSKYGSKINDVLSNASEKLRQATDFVKKQIDDFEERIFGKGKANDSIAKSDSLKIDNINTKQFTTEPFGKDGKLKKNIRYKTGEYDYFYETDDLGRINLCETKELHIKNHEGRLAHNSATPGKLEDDHAGHLIADIFGGSPELDNLVSQAKVVNQKEYRKIERDWQNALAPRPTKQNPNPKQRKVTDIKIEIIYDADNIRPKEFRIEYCIDGIMYFPDAIPNI